MGFVSVMELCKRVEIGIDGLAMQDKNAPVSGKIPALSQQFRIVVVSTLCHADSAILIASS